MIKRFAIVVGALVTVSLFSGQADAQTYGGGNAKGSSHAFGSPTVSPYLNLQAIDQFGIQGGYQTLVKPIVEGRKASNANSFAISGLQSQLSGGGGGGGSAGKGRASSGYYLNYSHYYQGMR